MIKIYEVDEGGVSHWVLARSAEMAIEFVGLHIVQNCGDELGELTTTEVPNGKPFSINLDDMKITHTPEEWAAIYDHKPRYLASSEY